MGHHCHTLALGIWPWASRAPSPPEQPSCLLCVDAQKLRHGPASSPAPHKNALLPSSGHVTLPRPFSPEQNQGLTCPHAQSPFLFFLI